MVKVAVVVVDDIVDVVAFGIFAMSPTVVENIIIITILLYKLH